MALRPVAAVLQPEENSLLFAAKSASSLSYTPDGRYLAISGGGSASVDLCAGANGSQLRTFATVPRIYVAGVAVSPLDGRYVAVAG